MANTKKCELCPNVCQRNSRRFCSKSCATTALWRGRHDPNMDRNCLNCKVAFHTCKSLNQIYCSNKCYVASNIKGQPSRASGYRWPDELRASKTASGNSNWKDDDVGYSGLHKWIRRKYGQPSTCEHCYEGQLFGQKIHWANKSGKYLRDRNDWLRLCSLCHKKYDRVNHITIHERFSKEIILWR